MAEFAQEDLPVKLSQVPAPPDNVTLTNSFPAHVFEPAVLLTPPRQKSSSGFSPLQDGKQASSQVVWLLFYAFMYVSGCVHCFPISRILEDTEAKREFFRVVYITGVIPVVKFHYVSLLLDIVNIKSDQRIKGLNIKMCSKGNSFLPMVQECRKG